MSETLVAPTVTPDELETWPTFPVDPHKEGVAREAARLDRMEPGWHDRVDIENIVMSSYSQCIIGQVYAGTSFYAAYDGVRADAVARGDEVYSNAYGANACGQHWINEILDRRAA